MRPGSEAIEATDGSGQRAPSRCRRPRSPLDRDEVSTTFVQAIVAAPAGAVWRSGGLSP
jgi:hypothetical protein